jgi:ABC-type transport system substrate-binding protein
MSQQTKLVTFVLDFSSSQRATQYLNLGFNPKTMTVINPMTNATSQGYTNVVKSSLEDNLCILNGASTIVPATYKHDVQGFRDNTTHTFELEATVSGQVLTSKVIIPILFRS